MVKSTVRIIVYTAIVLGLLVAIVGVTPTDAGHFVRTLLSYVVEFAKSFNTKTSPSTP
jgi:hypothetical protein